MDISIKNDRLEQHFIAEQESAMQQAHLSPDADAYKDPAAGSWGVKHPESIFFGYLQSFLSACADEGVPFDILYDGLPHLGAGLTATYRWYKDRYTPEVMADVIAKTLAAVLSYVAVNEHDMWFRNVSYLASLQKKPVLTQPLWADVFSIMVGKDNHYDDLLPYTKAAVKVGTLFSPNGLTVKMAEVVAAYRNLTGVDITAYGVKDVTLS